LRGNEVQLKYLNDYEIEMIKSDADYYNLQEIIQFFKN